MKLDFDPKKNITSSDHFILPFKKVNKKINDLLVVRKIVKNWYTVLLFRLGLKKPRFLMQLRNGKKIEIKKSEDYFKFWESNAGQSELLKQLKLNYKIKILEKNKIIELKFNNKIVKFYYDFQKQLSNTLGMIREQFIEQQYEWLNVKGNNVIDIGANIGDTAIYFALNGAKHVYAFEPYPYSYEIALKNIKLNGLEDEITLLNIGCGKKGYIKIDTNYKNFGGTDLKHFKKGEKIKIMTLSDIIKRFNLNNKSVLKVDCEDCEYDVLLKTEVQDLRKFEQIQLEYHYGYINLEDKLRNAGFKIIHGKPNYSFNKEAENNDMFIGSIKAVKIK